MRNFNLILLGKSQIPHIFANEEQFRARQCVPRWVEVLNIKFNTVKQRPLNVRTGSKHCESVIFSYSRYLSIYYTYT